MQFGCKPGETIYWSPSPEPIYNNEGKRLNTREYRTRKKLEEERHRLVQEAMSLNAEYKPPPDYKPPVIRVNDKVMIPQEEHPDINFVGLLIGPRGNTLKNLEKETGAKIIIRGKGSVKEGKIGRKDGQPLPGEDEPLHAYVTANNPENVNKAVEKIKEIIRQGIEVPEGQNDLRRQQLRELALLNGTLRENDGLAKLKQLQQAQTIVTNTIICSVCGGAGHIAQDCKEKKPGDTFRFQQAQTPVDKAKMDSEYMSLMAELGEGPPPQKNDRPMNSFSRPPMSFHHPPNPMSINPPWSQHNAPKRLQIESPPVFQNPQLGMPPQVTSSHNPVMSAHRHQNIGPPGVVTIPPTSNVGMPPWQQMTSSNQTGVTSTTTAVGLRPPLPTLLTAPPPPPPACQPLNAGGMPWLQHTQVAPVPPPPPVTSSPWQPASMSAPPPPPSNLPPWQQQQQTPPPSGQATMASPVAPPPPSQGNIYNPVGAPPPPPPGRFEMNAVGRINPHLVPPPPPPPPS
ncbi:splicing factor 1-like isoform X2 [Gigantopelta aegis]|uniref:splicing factor 1-like isoform X2 n=1 Tax=Gigantopelta aegis TaxID=1735272 RepID=UPI001B88A57C|nr:splicing factor 1-like isoform X2 [Gigantopelta aegis]